MFVDNWKFFLEKDRGTFDCGWMKTEFIIGLDLELANWFLLVISDKDYDFGLFDWDANQLSEKI